MAKEPQGYGSQKDWVTGKTGNQVNDPKSAHPAKHDEFYENRQDQDEPKGGTPPPEQVAESAEAGGRATEGTTPVQKVTDQKGGAKREGFFKNRDYK